MKHFIQIKNINLFYINYDSPWSVSGRRGWSHGGVALRDGETPRRTATVPRTARLPVADWNPPLRILYEKILISLRGDAKTQDVSVCGRWPRYLYRRSAA